MEIIAACVDLSMIIVGFMSLPKAWSLNELFMWKFDCNKWIVNGRFKLI